MIDEEFIIGKAQMEIEISTLHTKTQEAVIKCL